MRRHFQRVHLRRWILGLLVTLVLLATAGCGPEDVGGELLVSSLQTSSLESQKRGLLLSILFVLPLDHSKGSEVNPARRSAGAFGLRMGLNLEPHQPSQPVQPLAAAVQTRAGADGQPVSRLLTLNIAGQVLEAGGQLADGPNFVDIHDLDFNLESRIDIDAGLGSFYEPQDLAVSADGSTVVVAARGTDTRFVTTPTPVPNHLALIDTEGGTVARRINLSADAWPASLVLSPDGATAYVLLNTVDQEGFISGAALRAVDLASGTVTPLNDALSTGTNARDLAITPDGALLFALADQHLFVFDTRTDTLIATVGDRDGFERLRFSSTVNQLAMHPHGTTLYVSDAGFPEQGVGVRGVLALDTATLEYRAEPIAGMEANSFNRIAVSSDGRVVYHAASPSGVLTALDAVTLETLQSETVSEEGVARVALAPLP